MMSSCHHSSVAAAATKARFLLLPNLLRTQKTGRNPWHKYGSCNFKYYTRWARGGLTAVQSYGTTSASSSAFLSAAAAEEKQISVEEKGNAVGEGFELLVNENGWRVRRMVDDQNEMRKVAKVQAEAFHEPVLVCNDMFLEFFQAEVLAGLRYRFRNSGPNRYACLIAQPASDSEIQDEVVGVVDITASIESDVLQHVQGEAEYLYVSGIAVSNKFRRQKVATALLKACEMVSIIWGFKYLALRAYEDDLGARTLYANAGFQEVAGDPHWNTTWIGKKRRLLMIKECSLL